LKAQEKRNEALTKVREVAAAAALLKSPSKDEVNCFNLMHSTQ